MDNEDLISIEQAKEAIRKKFPCFGDIDINPILDSIPSVTPMQTEITIESALDYLHKIGWLQRHDKEMTEFALSLTSMQSGWIKLFTREMTKEEREHYRFKGIDDAKLLNCQLPEDGEEVLISYGDFVGIETFCRNENDGCYFEGIDIEDVDAWMPLPAPYEGEKMESEKTLTCKGEAYPGEFEAMDHNGRMDALESEEQA